MKTWTSDQIIDYGFALAISSWTVLILHVSSPWFWWIFLFHLTHFVLGMRLLHASQVRLREGRRELKENLAALNASLENIQVQVRFQDDLKEALDAVVDNLSDIGYHTCPCGTRGIKLYVPSKLHWMVLCPDGHHSIDATRNRPN